MRKLSQALPLQALAFLALGGALVLGGLVLPSGAEAQSVAMLGPGQLGRTPTPEAIQNEANQAVYEALRAAGATVIPNEDARRRMSGEPFEDCAGVSCGFDVVAALHVDYAVLITISMNRQRATAVAITLVDERESAGGEAEVGEGTVAAAARSAFEQAQQRYQATRTGFLRVTSQPAGASVVVDGRPIGETPVERHLLPAGPHTVSISLDGYRAIEREVQVPLHEEAALTVELEIGMQVGGGGNGHVGPGGPTTRSEPHWANWLIGGGLAALGVGLLVPAIANAALAGQCSSPNIDLGFEGARMTCEEEHTFGAISGALLGIGIAALAGGVVFLALQPLQMEVQVEASPQSGGLRLRGRF